MSNINKRIKELTPYVLGIRFKDTLSVVDTNFKEGWELPPSNDIGYETMASKPNYYMLYPNNEDIGVDEMLDYVGYVIKVNVEREMKIELLQVKIRELKEIFGNYSLETCKTLKFNFSDTLNDTSDDEDYNIPIMSNKEGEDKKEKEITSEINESSGTYSHAEGFDTEASEVTSHAEGFNTVASGPYSHAQGFKTTAKVGNETFDLPPKKGDKIMVEDFEEPQVVCKCDPNDPNDVCPVCIEY
jgi:hypothetical protein